MTAKNTVWADYTRAVSGQNRTIWMASGEVGTGKTRFGLQQPAPVLVQSLDLGVEGVIDDILEDMPAKDVYVKEYDWAPQAEEFNQEQAIVLRDQILADFAYGLKHARSILWDKEGDIREVFEYADLGGPTDGSVKDWAKVNRRYFDLLNRVKSVPGVNMGFIQSMKDEWVSTGVEVINPATKKPRFNKVKSGRRLRAGYSRLDEVVMVEMHFVRQRGEFFFEVGKCRQNSRLNDQRIPACDFADFGTLLRPGTEREDWQ